MNVEINVGFSNVDKLPPEKVEQTLNARQAMLRAAMHRLGADAVGTRVVWSEYEGPYGTVREPTIVVQAKYISDMDLRLGVTLYGFAAEWGEDCIAFLVNGRNGYLVGPNAAEWGNFNPEFFVRYAA
jgi:hypothetical protein